VKAFIAARRSGTPSTRKLSDGGGLYLMITESGTPMWRLKFRLGGKEQLLALGAYPDVGLEAVRERRRLAKAQISDGQNPATVRRVARASSLSASDTTFGGVAALWLEKQKREWSGIHYEKSERALERDVLPTLGALPIADITAAMIADTVERISKRGATETAGRVLQHITRIYRLARSRGLVRENVAVDVHEVLPRRRSKLGRPALVKFDELRDVLRRADLAPLSPAVRLANRLIAFTAQRIGNVVTATWDQFNLDADVPLWTIPRALMQVKDREHDHRVVLGPTIAAELTAWQSMTSSEGYVFPSPTGRAFIGREGVEKIYRVTLGLDGIHSPHAWRTSFSTMARDLGEFERDVVELVLDHVSDSQTVRVYNKAQRLPQRVKLAEWWDSQLTRTG